MTLEVGIAFDLKSDFLESGVDAAAGGPDDRLEEYDSDSTVDAIAAALEANGYRTRRLGGGRRLIEALLASPPDLVFNIAEGFGTRSREAHVPALLEMLKVPFTHSDPVTLGVTLDKSMAKRIVASMGVRTPHFGVVTSASQAAELDLVFPVIAKPLFEGSSIGIRKSSRVGDKKALCDLVDELVSSYEQQVLIEEFCSGPEFTVGILGTGDTARPIAAMEIVPKKGLATEFVYSIEVKRNYKTEVDYQVPPKRPKSVVHAVEELALHAYRALGCRDVGRVDVRLDANGDPHFIEVNPLPGINPVTGDLVILSERSGISYNQLVGRIVESARTRWRL